MPSSRKRSPSNLRRFAGASLLTLMIAAAGCESEPPVPAGERIGTALIEVWRSGDRLAAEDLLDPAVVWEDRSSGTMAQGFPEAVEYLLGLHSWAESLFVDMVSIQATDHAATIEWVMEGVTRPTDDPTARSHFHIDGVTVIQIESGRIVGAVDYSNPVGLILARGGSVTLPDGTQLQPTRIEDDAGG